MNAAYIKLFGEIARTINLLSERVMEANHLINDEHGEQTAQIMRDDYAQLHDRLMQDNFDPKTLTKQDYAKILVGVMVVVNNLKDRIENQQKAIDNYQLQIAPKLQRIIDECSNDEEAFNLANELFTIDEINN